MGLPKFQDLKILKTENEINQEIFLVQKNLFDLRMKRSTNQNIKSHLFVHYKRRIAQLQFKKYLLNNEKI